MRPAKGWIYLLLCSIFLTGLTVQGGSKQSLGSLNPGVVVEKLVKSIEGKVDLQEGDILLRWTQGGVHGEIQSPFDLDTILVEEVPKGSVALEGLRGNESRVWRLG